MPDYSAECEKWLASGVLTAEERAELERVKNDEEEIKSRFFAQLEFGTAGLRGVMGAGLNRMNRFVVSQATQALAELIVSHGEEAKARGCVICHDCRNNSRAFAERAACVMAGNGVHVRLFPAMRPTPELSFAIRKYGAIAGINITASHNPREYNGYKVYWEDGAQLVPDKAERVAAVMAKTDIFHGAATMDYDEAREKGIIELLGHDTDEAFINAALAQLVEPECVAKAADMLKIVYTPFHGAGGTVVPEALEKMGVKQLYPVPEQMREDGDFSTVQSPNPENPEGFALSIALADKVGADIIIGTDPDSDRIGVMVREKSGEFRLVSGNQLGVLLIHHILTNRREKGTLPANAAVLKTIVTTDMAAEVARANGAECFETFTGFKYMADLMKRFDEDGSHKTVFAYEESFGCLIGDFVRDKDAVTSSVLTAELAAHYALRGMSLFDALDELYEKYGYYFEKTLNFVMPGIDGMEKRRALMESLRAKPPRKIAGIEVSALRDYLAGLETDMATGKAKATPLTGSDVLIFVMQDGTKLAVRPSGTEPKIKMYILAKSEDKESGEKKLKEYEQAAKLLAE